MDYLKLIALALSPVVAVYAILVTYKAKSRTGDPTTEKEVLTRGGKVALVLVVVAGLFSVSSEWSNQRKKQNEKNAETQQVMEQLERLERELETLNRGSSQLVSKADESLLILRQLQGPPVCRRQHSGSTSKQ